jgi:hypothetical protein
VTSETENIMNLTTLPVKSFPILPTISEETVVWVSDARTNEDGTMVVFAVTPDTFKGFASFRIELNADGDATDVTCIGRGNRNGTSKTAAVRQCREHMAAGL